MKIYSFMSIKDFDVEDIDAETAAKYLASAIGDDGKSVNCRRKNTPLSDSYAEDIVSNRWHTYVADPVMFDSNGRMRNGQHRMRAILKASVRNPNIKIRCLVQRNVPVSEFEYVDSGIPRSLSTRSGVRRQHVEVFNSIYNDQLKKNRHRISTEATKEMDKKLGSTVDDFILAGKQPPLNGQTFGIRMIDWLKDGTKVKFGSLHKSIAVIDGYSIQFQNAEFVNEFKQRNPNSVVIVTITKPKNIRANVELSDKLNTFVSKCHYPCAVVPYGKPNEECMVVVGVREIKGLSKIKVPMYTHSAGVVKLFCESFS